MDFKTLYEKVSPRLKKIALRYRGSSYFIDSDDLYQEMCMHLWDRFKNGMPEDMNEAYVIRGCEFHILNFLRKTRDKAIVLSLDRPFNEENDTLQDILSDTGESLERYLDRKMLLDKIRNNGLSRREKEVFLLLLKGYTLREIGKELGISHVMVNKFKQRIIKKWQKKLGVTK
ncbi:MAG: sigma-70 family RNA polymerase sigma factor [Caldiserica bacterium]|nr:sigma-70 family RNA polymerase sigma factor [Caldisericota bacterium]